MHNPGSSIRPCIHWKRCGVLFLLCLLPGLASAQNGEATLPESEPILVLNHPEKAVLIVGPNSVLFHRPMKEADLPVIGCTYTVDDPVQLAALAGILARGKFVRHPAKHEPNVRLALYLDYPGGRKTKFLFQTAFRGEGMRGLFNDVIPIVSHREFEREIRSFAAALTPSKSNWYCDSDRAYNLKHPETSD